MEQKSLTIEEIKKIVDEIIEQRLFKYTETSEGESFPTKLDTPSEGGCLESFANSLRSFIEKKYPSSSLMMKLNEEQLSGEDRGYLENVVSNISGITRQQLVVIFLFMYSNNIILYILM